MSVTRRPVQTEGPQGSADQRVTLETLRTDGTSRRPCSPYVSRACVCVCPDLCTHARVSSGDSLYGHHTSHCRLLWHRGEQVPFVRSLHLPCDEQERREKENKHADKGDVYLMCENNLTVNAKIKLVDCRINRDRKNKDVERFNR